MRVLTIILMTAMSVLMSCATSNVMHTSSDWEAQSTSKVGSAATIYIGSVDIDCKVISISNDSLTISMGGLKSKISSETITIDHGGLKSEIPTAVITKIDFAKKSKMIIGGSVGIAAGVGLGLVVGPEVSGAKGAKTLVSPIPMAIILAGGVGGALLGGSFANSETFIFDNTLTPHSLTPELGSEITPNELRGYSIFEDLVKTFDENILQVQIFKLKDGRFFLLYDESYLGIYRVGGKIVDEKYLNAQIQKIKKG